MFTLTYEKSEELLKNFVWQFKDGDNILYNFQILFLLLQKQKDSSPAEKSLFNKPICVVSVSIIECIFNDLMARLDKSTSHFPAHLFNEKYKIKSEISSDRVRNKKYGFFQLKNYSMQDMLDFFKKFKILGPENASIYEELKYANYLRNRIHIYNYFGSFHIDEPKTFTDGRTTAVLKLLQNIMEIMSVLYARPWIRT